MVLDGGSPPRPSRRGQGHGERVFASTVSLSARLALGLPSFVVRGGASRGDVFKVMTRTERRWGRREKVHEPRAPTLVAERQNVSSRRRTRPIDAHRESVRFRLKMTHCGSRLCIAASETTSICAGRVANPRLPRSFPIASSLAILATWTMDKMVREPSSRQ